MVKIQQKLQGNLRSPYEHCLWRSFYLIDLMPSSAEPTRPVDREQISGVVRPSGESKGSIALDQWRGLALILVLISHALFFTNRVNGAGRIGVNLFFFISGILSYRSLHKQLGAPAIPLVQSFWFRRLRRLYPALLAYVGIMLVAVAVLRNIPNLPPNSDVSSYLHSLPWALTYTINYKPLSAGALEQLWSLSCEMQFYVLAPLVFLLGGVGSRRRFFVFFLLTFVFVMFGLIYPLRAVHLESVRYHFEVAAWPMMLGFFCEYTKRWFLMLNRTVVRTIFGLGVLALVTALVAMPFGIGGKKLVVALGGLLLLPCIFAYLFGLPFPGKVGGSLAWIGQRTYSIYLWQQPLTICGYLPNLLQPVGALIAIVIGGISFRLFEKPFLTSSRSHKIV